MEPTLRQFRYFIAVANAGQVSRAAMDINVSQSAVTAAIKGLEELIGAPLFERHAGGVTLTYEGNLFLDHARHIVANVERRYSCLGASAKTSAAPSIWRSATRSPAISCRRISPASSRGFPNVKINMTEAVRSDIEEGLIAGTFDPRPCC